MSVLDEQTGQKDPKHATKHRLHRLLQKSRNISQKHQLCHKITWLSQTWFMATTAAAPGSALERVARCSRWQPSPAETWKDYQREHVVTLGGVPYLFGMGCSPSLDPNGKWAINPSYWPVYTDIGGVGNNWGNTWYTINFFFQKVTLGTVTRWFLALLRPPLHGDWALWVAWFWAKLSQGYPNFTLTKHNLLQVVKPGRREIYLIWILHIKFIHKCAAFTLSLMTLVIVTEPW